jgi:citrate synthase
VVLPSDERAAVSAERLSTAEAAARLGVKPETLYAYVSRGVIERQREPGGVSTYASRDIEKLARAGRRTKSLPPLVFPSALTRIADGRLSYRGADAVAAALDHRFEEVAEWLWTARWPDHTSWPFDSDALDEVLAAQSPIPAQSLPLDRFRIITAVAGAGDPVRHDTDPAVVVPTARRLLRLLAHGLPRADGREARRAEPARSMAEVLWTRLTRLPRTPERIDLLDAALGLLADHELASSTLAVRMAAMVRADVYEVVGAGLNVIGGLRHGGASLAIEAALRDAARFGVRRALDGRVGDGGRLDGFGHPLYPDGDPRARALLDRLPAIDAPGDRLETVDAVLDAMAARGAAAPNVDVALAAVSFCADMAPGSGEAVFALARCAGWIAHALEQYEQPTFMRARVDYVGPKPGGPPRSAPPETGRTPPPGTRPSTRPST